MTLVTIGMPTRAGSPWIREALDSIFAQTHTEWRLLVSENGAGADELAETLAPYLEDPRVSHHVIGRDIGAAGNHTFLTGHGDGPYVALLHDDDVWDAGFLARRVEFLDEHPECGFVFGRWATIDESGARVAVSACDLTPGMHPPEVVVPLMLRSYPVGMTSLLVRRSAYAAVGPWLDMPWMDVEMWFRMAARFPTGYLDVVDSAWRRHTRQWTAQVGMWGETLTRVYAQFEQTLRDVQGVDFDLAPLRRLQGEAALQAALDAVEGGDAALARARLGEAVAIEPRLARDRRALLLRVALRLHAPGRRAIVLLRHASWKV